MANKQDHCSDETYAELLQQRREVELRIVSRACEDDAFREKLISDPKAAIEDELGIAIPAGITVKVHEETPTTAYLRIPSAPKHVKISEELSDQALETVAGGGFVIGIGKGCALVVVKKDEDWGVIIY